MIHILKERIKQFILMAILLAWTFMVIYPFFWLLFNTLKSEKNIFEHTFGLPWEFRWQNYETVLKFPQFFMFFRNTIFVTAFSLFFLAFFATMASFALARFRFKGDKIFFAVFTAGILLPGSIAIIPLFVIFVKLHLLNSIFTLPIPYVATSLSTAIFILVGFLRSLPHELDEAAKIDGCNLWQIYLNVALPLSKPGILTIVITNGISFWNQFLLPLLLASEEGSRTLSIGIRMFVGKELANYDLALTALMISIIPTVIFYIALHDKILKGLVLGAVKG